MSVTKLVAFFGKHECKDEYILSILEMLYAKDYTNKISNLRSDGVSFFENVSPENLANELYDLWTYREFVDSWEDKKKFQIIENLLKTYNVKVQEENNDWIGMKLGQNNQTNHPSLELVPTPVSYNRTIILPSLKSLENMLDNGNNRSNKLSYNSDTESETEECDFSKL